MVRRTMKYLLYCLVTIFILAGVVAFVGFDETFRALSQVGMTAFFAVGALIAGLLVCHALAWKMLNRVVGHHMSFPALLESVTVGLAGNIITPSTYLGGEPVKVLYAGRRADLPYRPLAGTILLAKYLEALSFLFFVVLCTLVAVFGYGEFLFTSSRRIIGFAIVIAAVAGLLLFILLWISLLKRFTPLSGMIRFIEWVCPWKDRLRRLRRKTISVEHQASHAFRKEQRAVAPAFCSYVIIHLLILLKPLAFFYLGWSIGLSAADLGLLFLASQVLLAVQLAPSGAGTLELGLFGVIALADMPISKAQCTAFLLCVRFWDAIIVGAGMYLAFRVGIGFFSQATPELVQSEEEQ